MKTVSTGQIGRKKGIGRALLENYIVTLEMSFFNFFKEIFPRKVNAQF